MNDIDPKFQPAIDRLRQLIDEGVKPRSAAIQRAAEETGVDHLEFRKAYAELGRKPTTGTPDSGGERTRLSLKLDDTAKAVLANFATLNGLGFAPTVAEVLARASQVACADIANHYEQATAKLRKIES